MKSLVDRKNEVTDGRIGRIKVAVGQNGTN